MHTRIPSVSGSEATLKNRSLENHGQPMMMMGEVFWKGAPCRFIAPFIPKRRVLGLKTIN